MFHVTLGPPSQISTITEHFTRKLGTVKGTVTFGKLDRRIRIIDHGDPISVSMLKKKTYSQ